MTVKLPPGVVELTNPDPVTVRRRAVGPHTRPTARVVRAQVLARRRVEARNKFAITPAGTA